MDLSDLFDRNILWGNQEIQEYKFDCYCSSKRWGGRMTRSSDEGDRNDNGRTSLDPRIDPDGMLQPS